MEQIFQVLIPLGLIGIGVHQFIHSERISREWYFSERGGLGVRIMALILIAIGMFLAAASLGLV
jgi:hypothetical protein